MRGETTGITSSPREAQPTRSPWKVRRVRGLPVSDPALWNRMQATALPTDGRPGLSHWGYTEPFVIAVAEDLQLDPDHAEIVVKEYRRFLYLCAVSEARLTPSGLVDAAWHVHLERSEDAYRRFCAEVIGTPIAHESGLSAAESAEGYRRTLDLYETEFGRAAPESVWPTPATSSRIRRAWRVFWIGLALSFLSAFAVGIWFKGFDAEANPFNAAVFLLGLLITCKAAGPIPTVIEKGEASCGG